ncbi:unnamed protein product [Prorocentrum cordatum]|uniref:RNA-directed RNA polymerase n=1 Tax=Prorocentrum cordatum TaxID=2364126 RepID=A0ABN9VUM3_9DINO|nr:unnamed protein product [Polarella glacialis]
MQSASIFAVVATAAFHIVRASGLRVPVVEAFHVEAGMEHLSDMLADIGTIDDSSDGGEVAPRTPVHVAAQQVPSPPGPIEQQVPLSPGSVEQQVPSSRGPVEQPVLPGPVEQQVPLRPGPVEQQVPPGPVELCDVLALGVIEIDDSPPEKSKHSQRSHAHAAQAREGKAKKHAQKLRGQLAKQKAEHDMKLKSVALVPGVSQLIGNKSSTTLGKLKRHLTSDDFAIASRACFLPSKKQCAIGVDHRRLMKAACDIAVTRQLQGFRGSLKRSRDSITDADTRDHRFVHLGFGHLWDEVEVRQAWEPGKRYRVMRKNVAQPTLIQRSTAQFTLLNRKSDIQGHFIEYMIAKPFELQGQKAKHIYPGLLKAIPDELNIVKWSEGSAPASSAVSTFTFQPMADRASANLSILKMWGQCAEDILKERKESTTCFFWPDTCGIHAHHRGKLKLKAVKKHTMRHFSIASANRYRTQLERNIMGVELLVGSNVDCIMQPPPEDVEYTFQLVVDVLFDLSADFHLRKGGADDSQFIKDLKALMPLLNGDMRGERIKHYCRHPQTGRPCCNGKSDTIDKLCTGLVHALFGSSDPRPCESRWTNVLMNMKRTLLRRLVYKIGIDSFVGHPDARGVVDADEEEVPLLREVDGMSDADYWKHVFNARAKKIKAYYGDERHFWELMVFVGIFEACDSTLLYPLLGDPIVNSKRDDQRSKMDILLDKGDTAIGKFSQKMLDLADSWMGLPTRKPWCLLDMLGAPLTDQTFSRFARSQLLKLNSVMLRRYESRFSAYPYRLYPLASSTASLEEAQRIAHDAINAPWHMKDSYTKGITSHFNTVGKMLSSECIAVLFADFRQHAYGTDFIERLNSECTAKIPDEAPRKGLSAYMLEKNKYMKAIKAVLGRRLTRDETTSHAETFKHMVADCNQDALKDAYDLWRQSPSENKALEVPTYRPIWGGGCNALPITGDEFCHYITANGWPSYQEVFDDSLEERMAQVDESIDFELFKNVDLWGVPRGARNVDRAASRAPHAFEFVEKGIMSYMTYIGTQKAEEGDTMLMVEGPGVRGGRWRCAVIVSDITWNPRVFDITWNNWVIESNERSEDVGSSERTAPVKDLVLPCWVRIADRSNKVSERFKAIDSMTSDVWIDKLVTELESMTVYEAEYEIDHAWGSLRLSKIVGLKRLGILWEPSMTKPLSFAAATVDADKSGIAAVGAIADADDPSAAPPEVRADGVPDDDGREPAGGGHEVEREMDLADDLESVTSVEEMEDAFSEMPAQLEAPVMPPPADDYREVKQPEPDDEGDADFIGMAAEHVSEAVAEPDAAAPPKLDGGEGETPPHDDADASESKPRQKFSPKTPQDYYYLGGRQVCRIQRGKPKNSITITCYFHSGCSLCVTERLGPKTDEEVFRWLYSVPETPAGADAAKRKELSAAHRALGKGQWAAKRPAR